MYVYELGLPPLGTEDGKGRGEGEILFGSASAGRCISGAFDP